MEGAAGSSTPATASARDSVPPIAVSLASTGEPCRCSSAPPRSNHVPS